MTELLYQDRAIRNLKVDDVSKLKLIMHMKIKIPEATFKFILLFMKDEFETILKIYVAGPWQ